MIRRARALVADVVVVVAFDNDGPDALGAA